MLSYWLSRLEFVTLPDGPLLPVISDSAGEVFIDMRELLKQAHQLAGVSSSDNLTDYYEYLDRRHADEVLRLSLFRPNVATRAARMAASFVQIELAYKCVRRWSNATARKNGNKWLRQLELYDYTVLAMDGEQNQRLCVLPLALREFGFTPYHSWKLLTQFCYDETVALLRQMRPSVILGESISQTMRCAPQDVPIRLRNRATVIKDRMAKTHYNRSIAVETIAETRGFERPFVEQAIKDWEFENENRSYWLLDGLRKIVPLMIEDPRKVARALADFPAEVNGWTPTAEHQQLLLLDLFERLERFSVAYGARVNAIEHEPFKSWSIALLNRKIP